MTQQTPENLGGLPQSFDPEMYQLPPVPDWALECMPAENPREASPLLYSEALADLGVRHVLIAVAETVSVSNNHNGAKTVYDTSSMPADELRLAIDGAEKLRNERGVPKEVRKPVLDFLPYAKTREKELTLIEEENLSLEEHGARLDHELLIAARYCEERGTDSHVETISALCSRIIPMLGKENGFEAMKIDEEFENYMNILVSELSEDPEKLVEFSATIFDMEAVALSAGEPFVLPYYLTSIMSQINRGFKEIAYPREDFQERVAGWMSLYQNVAPDRTLDRERDMVVVDDPEIQEKATLWALQLASLSIQNTIMKAADDTHDPARFIDSVHELVWETLDFERPNKINFARHILEICLKTKRVAGHFIRCASELEASQGTKDKANDLWLTLPEIGIEKDSIGLTTIGKKGDLDPEGITALGQALPSHRKLFDRRIPLSTRDREARVIERRVNKNRTAFLADLLVASPDAPKSLLRRVLESGKHIVMVKSSPQDA